MASLANTAHELIVNNGRSVVLRQSSPVAADPDHPELGPESADSYEITVTGVLLRFSAEDIEKSPVRRDRQALYVSALNSQSQAVEQATEAEIDGATYRVWAVERFQPGPTVLYYRCEVSL